MVVFAWLVDGVRGGSEEGCANSASRGLSAFDLGLAAMGMMEHNRQAEFHDGYGRWLLKAMQKIFSSSNGRRFD
jgi:hypothetical protein